MLRGQAVRVRGAVLGILAVKLVGVLLARRLGVAIWLAVFVVELASIVGFLYLAYRLLRRWATERASEAG